MTQWRFRLLIRSETAKKDVYKRQEPDIAYITMSCDQYNIPVATNIATAELLILGLARGDLDWRLNLK